MKNIVYKVVPSCVCWFIIPINYSYIPLINPRYWTYLHQLSLANYGAPSCRSFKKEIQSAANHLKIFENPIPIVCTSNHCIAKISCFLLQKIFTIPIKSQQRPRVFSQRPNLQLGFAYPKKIKIFTIIDSPNGGCSIGKIKNHRLNKARTRPARTHALIPSTSLPPQSDR